MRIIFFGTPRFSEIILEYLVTHELAPVAVVTNLDKPVGRNRQLTPSIVKQYALDRSIPVLQPKHLKDETFLTTLSAYTPDVFVIASFGKILPQLLLEIPPKGTLNVHPSLLPTYRGPTPIQTAILNGDTETGITIMLTDTDMDHGPILASSKRQVAPGTTYKQLHDELAHAAGTLLIATLPKWVAGEITPMEQDHSKATYTKLLTKEDGQIEWSSTAEHIDRQVRAFEEWPGTHTFWRHNGKLIRLKIISGHVSNEAASAPPGTVIKTKNGALGVVCEKGVYIIDKLQMEGKGITDSISFLNGNQNYKILDSVI